VSVTTPLGMSFDGQADKGYYVMVCREGKNAAATGVIVAGQKILSVNGQALDGLDKKGVVSLIKGSPGQCALELLPDPEGFAALNKALADKTAGVGGATPQPQPPGGHACSPDCSGNGRGGSSHSLKRGSPGAGCSCSNQDTAGVGNVIAASAAIPLANSALYAPGCGLGMTPAYPSAHHVGAGGLQAMSDDPRAMPFNGMVGGGIVGGGMGGAAAGGGNDMMID